MNHAEIGDVGALGAGQRGKRKAVGIDDLSRPRLGPGGTSSSPVANSAIFGRR